jgi:alkaline phosphatase
MPKEKEMLSITRRSACLLVVLALTSLGCAQERVPKNVILFIGDGMGPEQVRAARLYKGEPLAFETFEHRGLMTTYCANSAITDSAAAATAMATGRKVNAGVLSVAIPVNQAYGEGAPMKTTLEKLAAGGKSTGLVTTSTITDATPAGFAAHVAKRSSVEEVARQYLTQTRPNILLGGGGHGMSPDKAKAAGYRVVMTREELLAVAEDGKTALHICGLFGEYNLPYEFNNAESYKKLPHLSEMTQTALNLLDKNKGGFFLMVEGGRIDHACHANNLEQAVGETLEFNRAIEVCLRWARGRTDTLIVVTADHETGGLSVEKDNGPGKYPAVSWSTKGHTATDVPLAAWGFGSQALPARLDNTHLPALMLDPLAFASQGKTLCWPVPPIIKPAARSKPASATQPVPAGAE